MAIPLQVFDLVTSIDTEFMTYVVRVLLGYMIPESFSTNWPQTYRVEWISFSVYYFAIHLFLTFSEEDNKSGICVAYLKMLRTLYLEAARKDIKYFGRILGHGAEIRTHNFSNVKQYY
jgi:hypothetical protein